MSIESNPLQLAEENSTKSGANFLSSWVKAALRPPSIKWTAVKRGV